MSSYEHNIIIIYMDFLHLQANLHCSYSLNSYLLGAWYCAQPLFAQYYARL